MTMPPKIWAHSSSSPEPASHGGWSLWVGNTKTNHAYIRADRVQKLVEALRLVSHRPSGMIWGEDSEVRSAMQDMEDMAEAALTEWEAEQ